jgi:hypothetical protein
MDIYIQNITKKNKSRYGVMIPFVETRIDVKQFFGRDDEFFIKQLMNDPDLIVNVVKSAGGESREAAIKIETEVKTERIKKDKIIERG